MLGFFSKRFFTFFSFALLGAILIGTYFLPIEMAHKVIIATFIGAAILWAFELIPLFATSLLIVIILSSFASARGVHSFVFFQPFASPIIILFFGGFVLAEVASKYGIALRLMGLAVKKVKTKQGLLFAFLFMSAFLSMWLSNTATAALLITMARPLLELTERKDPLRKALPIAIAIGCNIGGMATPIGTPPNAIAMGILAENGTKLTFFDWMAMATPLALLLLGVSFILLKAKFSIRKERIHLAAKETHFSKHSWLAMLIICFTIMGWLTTPFHGLSEAIVALAAVGVLAAFRLLEQEDIKKINWPILLLMWGGLALGEGIKTSGMLTLIAEQAFFQSYSYVLVAILCMIALGMSTFISNTATASLLLPFTLAVAYESQVLLVITVALSCSLALALIISTPPNAIAYSLGTFSQKELFSVGAVLSLIGLILILIGFEIVLPYLLSL